MNADQLFEKLKSVTIGNNICFYSREKCQQLLPIINEIEVLKKKHNAIVLAHSYVSPDILYTVADKSGDSYELSRFARDSQSKMIVYAAVKFMAETAKVINPEKRVFIASDVNGCTLADSIDAAKTKALKEKYPDHTFVCYINTTAEVKALCDVCVTSSNALTIIKNHPNDKIYFLPDKLMGKNLFDALKKEGIEKELIFYDGTCYVHEAYDPEMIDYLRLKKKDLSVLAHPECKPEVAKKSDFIGSTSAMMQYVRESSAENFLLLTECGLTARLQVELSKTNKKFIGMCTLCRYMKSNSLEEIAAVLRHPENFPKREIKIDKKVIDRAKRCIENMFYYTEKSPKKEKAL